MDRLFTKFSRYVTTEGEEPTLNILLFRMLSLSTAMLCLFLVIPSNFFQEVSPYLNPVVAVYAALTLVIYRLSLSGTHLFRTMFFLTLFLLNISWFLNGGSTGSIGLFYLSTVLFPLVLFRGRQRVTHLLLIILNYTALIFIEMHYQRLITPFISEHDRYFDLITGFAVSTFINGALFWVVVTSYEKKLSEHQRSLKEIRTSENKNNIILMTALDGFMLNDLQGRFLQPNQAFCEMTGYNEQELLAMGVADIDVMIPPSEVTEVIGQIVRQGRWRFETKLRRKDGTIIDVEISSQYQNFNDGEIINFARDISERKRSEAEIHQHRISLEKLVDERTNELKRSEMRFRSFVENAHDIVFTLAPDGAFTYVSPNWKSAFGYDLAETVGKPFPIFVHPDDIAGCFDYLQMVMTDGKAPNDCEYRVLLSNGEYTWYSATGSQIQDIESGRVEFLGVGRDISERKRAEAEKLKLERQLLHSQKLESLGIMAGGIAHDFNNLLHTILGNMEMAARVLPPDSAPQEYVADAIIAGKHAAHLTNLMLTYAGDSAVTRKELNLNILIRENTEIFKSVTTSAVSMELQITEIPSICADEGQIQQVVMNLITNAAESLENRSGIIRIATGVQTCDDALLAGSVLDEKPQAGRFVALEVTDNGCGMSKEVARRMFDPFFTTKFTGRGLGMSAVMGIMKSHSGALFVESEPGKGSTFRVLFPVMDSASPDETVIPAIKPAENDVSAQKPLSGLALVVDDEKSVRRTCSNMVRLCGFTVIDACDGIEAVARFREHADEIVFVLLDQTMPNMDGVSAMNEIYAIRPDMKVILASGFNEDELGERITGNQPAGFIRKPYSMGALETELRRVLLGEA